MPGWMVRLMPPAMVQPERSMAVAFGVVELDELGGVAAGRGVLDLVDHDVRRRPAGCPAPAQSLANSVAAAWMSLNSRFRCVGVAVGLVVQPRGEVERDLGLGEPTLASYSASSRPVARRSLTSVRSRRKYISRHSGTARIAAMIGVDLVTGLGRRHEVAVDAAAAVAEGVVEVPRDDRPAAGVGVLREVEVLRRRVDVLRRSRSTAA